MRNVTVPLPHRFAETFGVRGTGPEARVSHSQFAPSRNNGTVDDPEVIVLD